MPVTCHTHGMSRWFDSARRSLLHISYLWDNPKRSEILYSCRATSIVSILSHKEQGRAQKWQWSIARIFPFPLAACLLHPCPRKYYPRYVWTTLFPHLSVWSKLVLFRLLRSAAHSLKRGISPWQWIYALHYFAISLFERGKTKTSILSGSYSYFIYESSDAGERMPLISLWSARSSTLL